MSDSFTLRLGKAAVRAARRALIRHAGFVFASHLPVTPHASLVIAPHPDDEVLGAGGLIALKRMRGAPVHVLYLTDGEGALRAFDRDPDEVARQRRTLGEKACATLGVGPACLHRLRLPDGAIPAPSSACFDHAVESVRRIVSRLGVREVFCTHPADGWDDHVNAASIARAAVGGGSVSDTSGAEETETVELYDYLVWSWHSLNARGVMRLGWGRALQVNIDPVADQKHEAIHQYLGAIDPVSSRPYCGVLPDALLRAMSWGHELYFRVPEQELIASASGAIDMTKPSVAPRAA